LESQGFGYSDLTPPDQKVGDGLPESMPEALPEKKTHVWVTTIRELLETILLTIVIFLMIRFAVENYRIEGYSMEPNFHDGQFLLVNKLIYYLHPPERGDVIVFRFPPNPSKNYIKRVIGLPGDRVEIVEGRVYVNDQLLSEPYPLNNAAYTYGPVVVEPDEFFVLGDNRGQSSDSHSWGFVPRTDVIGEALWTYWPPELFGPVQEYSYASK
jgi:signal peptidase I